MKGVKKVLRFMVIILLMLLASMGVAVPISFNSREKFMDNEVQTEHVEKKDEESETDLKIIKE